MSCKQHKPGRCYRLTAAALTFAIISGTISVRPEAAVVTAAQKAAIPIITVDAANKRGDISPYTLGSNHRHAYGGFGMYDEENNRLYDDFLNKAKESGIGAVRYPGGTIANLFTWKDSVGPIKDRRNVVLGNSYKSVFPSYGLDEHMRFTEKIGAKAIYMVGEASETPESAADLVEYLNGVPGENKNGGVDWAQARADNGHPEPYGVVHFEIGNEMHLDNQRYWMQNPSVLGKTDFAKRYAEGDTVQMTGHVMRAYGTWDDNISTGAAGQKFYSRYNPVVKGSETIYVDGAAWKKAESFDSAAPDSEIYTFDSKTGEVTFGDGINGKIPPKGAKITADYQHTHAGFTEYYDAMKAVDPTIKIYACMERSLGFLDTDRCDGLVNHNYINFPSGVTTAEAMHDNYMTISDQLIARNADEDSFVKEKSGRNDFISAVTEFGTIPIPHVYSKNSSDIGRDEARSLSRGLAFAGAYIGSASQEAEIQLQQAYTAYSFGAGPDLPNADFVYNSLYAPDSNDPAKTIESATAAAYKLIGSTVGDSVRTSWIINNPTAGKSTRYEALKALATVNEKTGEISLIVLNRDPKNDITSSIDLRGFTINGEAKIRTLSAADITSCNTPAHPDDVKIIDTEKSLGKGGGSFCYTFPAHSLVSITLSGGASGETFTNNFEPMTFDATAPGSLPAPFKSENGSAYVAADPDDGANSALLVTRSGSDSHLTASLSGQDVAPGGLTAYGDIVKIKYRLKALQNSGRVDFSIKGGGAEASNLAFDNLRIKNGNKIRANYRANRWYGIEMLINHKTKTTTMYVDGKYLHCQHSYNQTVTAPLDLAVFDLETSDASFLIDDFSVSVCGTDIVRKITQTDDVTLTTEPANAPKLPERVFARFNTGETEERAVTWDKIEPSLYANEGVFTVNGAVSGLDIGVKAYITVKFPEIVKLESTAVTVKKGTAPKLPEQITAEYDNGETALLSVVWDDIPAEKYLAAGSFTVSGTVAGTALKATAEITVTDVYKISALCDKSLGSVSGAGSIDAGEKITLFAVPAAGCYFAGWSENGKILSYSARLTLTPASDMTLRAEFKKLSAPGGIKAVTSYNSVKLTWSRAEGADRYELFYKDSKNGGYKKLCDVAGLSFTHKGASVTKTYYYKLRSVSAYNTQSGFSAVKAAKPALKNPKLKKPSVKAKRIALSWSRVEGASGYAVYAGTKISGKYSAVRTLKARGCSLKTDKFKKGKLYIKIKAFRKQGGKKAYSAFSNRVLCKIK